MSQKYFVYFKANKRGTVAEGTPFWRVVNFHTCPNSGALTMAGKSQAASEDFPLWTFHVQLLLLIVPCQPGFDKNFGKLPEANEVTEIGVDRRGKSCYHNLALISRSGGIGRRPGLKIPWE